MKFVQIRQFNRPPTLMEAVEAMRQERAGYVAQGADSVSLAYEAAERELEKETNALAVAQPPAWRRAGRCVMPKMRTFSEQESLELTRHKLLYRRAKFLCRECGTVQRVADFFVGAT